MFVGQPMDNAKEMTRPLTESIPEEPEKAGDRVRKPSLHV